MAKCGTTSGQGDQVWGYFGQAYLWSDLPSGRDILWPSLKLLQMRLTFGQTQPSRGI